MFVARGLPDGSPDATFSDDGIVQVSMSMAAVGDIDVTADDRVVVLIRGDQKVELRRYNDDGSLDVGFGINGITTISTNPIRQAKTLLVTRAGKIVVAGSSAGVLPFVARFDADGALDTGFGVDGILEVPGSADVVGLTEQDDERILAVGNIGTGLVMRLWN